MCAVCTSGDLTWEVSSGRGEVYSWTTVWRPQSPAFEVPYVPVIVAMDEGWHVLADLVGCEHDAVHIGMPVEVEFFAHPGGITLPYFHPIGPDARSGGGPASPVTRAISTRTDRDLRPCSDR